MLLPLLLSFLGGSAAPASTNVIFWEVDQLECGVVGVRNISPAVGVRNISPSLQVRDISPAIRIYEVS